jgi:hypothetical protein
MLAGCTTRLQFDDFISETQEILSGNSQGCPLSMILYSFYIAPLLEIVNVKEGTSSIGYVDDGTLLAQGNTFEETHAKLRNLLEKPNGAMSWSTSHNSPFELSKLAIMDLTRSIPKASKSTDLRFNTQLWTAEPSLP